MTSHQRLARLTYAFFGSYRILVLVFIRSFCTSRIVNPTPHSYSLSYRITQSHLINIKPRCLVNMCTYSLYRMTAEARDAGVHVMLRGYGTSFFLLNLSNKLNKILHAALPKFSPSETCFFRYLPSPPAWNSSPGHPLLCNAVSYIARASLLKIKVNNPLLSYHDRRRSDAGQKDKEMFDDALRTSIRVDGK